MRRRGRGFLFGDVTRRVAMSVEVAAQASLLHSKYGVNGRDGILGKIPVKDNAFTKAKLFHQREHLTKHFLAPSLLYVPIFGPVQCQVRPAA